METPRTNNKLNKGLCSFEHYKGYYNKLKESETKRELKVQKYNKLSY